MRLKDKIMASRVVLQGLQRIGITASQATGFAAARFIQCMTTDDATGAFAAGNTKLNDGAGFTQSHAESFDGSPTRSAEVISHVSTLETVDSNFTIRRIALHDDTAANVGTAGTSATLVAGVDGQTIAKTTDFTLAITLKLSYTNV